MSDPYRAMAAAVQAQLEADSVLAPVTFDGDVTGTPQGYAVFYLQRLFEYRAGSADPVAVDWTLTVHSVGSTVLQSRAFSERVTAQLNTWRPSIDGWKSVQLKHTASISTEKNIAVQPANFYGIDQFSWRSDRA